jgi:hypothetical protein
MTRPSIDPQLMAALLDATPKRLLRKLDAEPNLAESWRWTTGDDEQLTVVSDTGERVTLAARSGLLRDSDQLVCSCLLSPRCLHLVAVARVLPLAMDLATTEPTTAAASEQVTPATHVVPLDDAKRLAARQSLDVGARLLATGAERTGGLLLAELLRCVHTARTQELHRLAALGLTVATQLRDLQQRAPQFDSQRYVDSLLDWLSNASALAREAAEVTPSLFGTARRRYTEVKNLRLYGLLSEPVISDRGYAGVVTYLADEDGRLWSVSDVRPGTPDRAHGAYAAGATLGEVTLSHSKLARQGLRIASGTASADGRLGAGNEVRAVAAPGCRFSDAPLARLWERTLEAQLGPHQQQAALPYEERGQGWDLVFLEGTLEMSSHGCLLQSERAPRTEGARAYEVVAPSDHASLNYRRNWKLLSGRRVRCIARISLARPGEVAVLALSPMEDAASLPAALEGRVMLGLDELLGAHAAGVGVQRTDVPQRSPTAVLAPLERRVMNVALGGAATLSAGIGGALRRDAAKLKQLMLPTAASALTALQHAAHQGERSLQGQTQLDHALLLQRWLRASTYLRAAGLHLSRAAWQQLP